MKKLILVLAIVCLAAGTAFSQDFLVKNSKPLMPPGSVAASVGVDFGFWSGLGIGGGVEYSIGQIDIPDLFPLTWGFAARGGVNFGRYSSFQAGVGGLGMMHFSTSAFNIPEWAQKFDFFAGIGLGFGFGYYGGLGFAWSSGINYHFTPNIAVRVETLDLPHLWRQYLGVQFKI